MPWRCDLGSLRPVRRLADGRVICDAYISRAGVFEYQNDDGSIRREYRSPEEVFHPDALASFSLAPVTDDHPPERLNSQNTRKYAVGSLGENVRQEGMHVHSLMTVFDHAAVQKMDNGKVEISSGYMVDVFDTPGVSPEGERYDAVQKNIRGNNGGHVAIVDAGRAGPTVHARMDGQVARWDSAIMRRDGMTATFMGNEPRGPGLFISVEGDLGMSLEELQKRLTDALAQVSELTVKRDTAVAALDGMTKERDAEKKRADTVEAERDDAKTKLDAAEKTLKERIDSEGSRIQSRVELLAQAREIVTDKEASAKLAGMTDQEVKAAVIREVAGDKVKLDGKSVDYIDARYETAVESWGESHEAHDQVRQAVSGADHREKVKADSTDPEVKAKQDRLKRDAERWKAPMKPIANKGA